MYIKRDNYALSVLVVRAGDGPEALLTRSVPDLQLYECLIHL